MAIHLVRWMLHTRNFDHEGLDFVRQFFLGFFSPLFVFDVGSKFESCLEKVERDVACSVLYFFFVFCFSKSLGTV